MCALSKMDVMLNLSPQPQRKKRHTSIYTEPKLIRSSSSSLDPGPALIRTWYVGRWAPLVYLVRTFTGAVFCSVVVLFNLTTLNLRVPADGCIA
jgi:hypothetical protein